jgi:hypothetical protein
MFYTLNTRGRKIHKVRKGRGVAQCGAECWDQPRRELPAFVPPGDKNSRCRRCFPEFVDGV